MAYPDSVTIDAFISVNPKIRSPSKLLRFVSSKSYVSTGKYKIRSISRSRAIIITTTSFMISWVLFFFWSYLSRLKKWRFMVQKPGHIIWISSKCYKEGVRAANFGLRRVNLALIPISKYRSKYEPFFEI